MLESQGFFSGRPIWWPLRQASPLLNTQQSWKSQRFRNFQRAFLSSGLESIHQVIQRIWCKLALASEGLTCKWLFHCLQVHQLLLFYSSCTFRFCRGARVGPDQWCAFTSTNMGGSPKAGYAGKQRAGAGVAVNVGKDVHITCSYLACVNHRMNNDD